MNLADYTPDRTAPQELSYGRADKWMDAYHKAFAEAMTGSPNVFDLTLSPRVPEVMDSEQYYPIMAAIGQALKAPGCTAESVGTAVLRAVAKVANEYASWRADEAAL